MGSATAATFDVATGKVTVNYAGAPAPSTATITDIALGRDETYFDLILDGARVPSASPGFPVNTMIIKQDKWAPSTSYLNFEPKKATISSFDLKDDTGNLKQIIYTDAEGTSNVLYKSSTITNANHYLDTSQKGTIVIMGDPPSAAIETEESSKSLPLWAKILICIMIIFYLLGVVYGISKVLSKKR